MKVKFAEIPYCGEEWKQAVKLREDILRKPLGSYFSQAELEEEKEHLQVVGYLGDELIATAVLVPEGNKIKMQRVVVKEGSRDHSIGSKMMVYCEDIARDKNFEEIYCHARDSAVHFYLKNAYEKEGDYFDEDGIPHLKMIKSL